MTDAREFDALFDEHPDDWEARAVYADRLEEQGDLPFATAQRWMAQHRKHSQADWEGFNWYFGDVPFASEHSTLPESMHGLFPNPLPFWHGKNRWHRVYPTRLIAELALAEALERMQDREPRRSPSAVECLRDHQPPSSPRPYDDRVSRLLELISRSDDVQLERSRHLVQAEDVPVLLAAYRNLENWDQRRCLVMLLKDVDVPGIEKVMLDYLRAPQAHRDRELEAAKATALTFIAEEYRREGADNYDADFLARRIDQCLSRFELQCEGPDYFSQRYYYREPRTYHDLDQRLLDAAMAGNTARAEQALADGAHIDVRSTNGKYEDCTPLLIALIEGAFETADFLIDRGANLNARRSDDPRRGQTPVWWAVRQGNIALFRKLLRLGADFDVRATSTFDCDGCAGSTPAAVAARNGNASILADLIDAGIDVNQVDDCGESLLMLGACHGASDIVRLLLESDAEVDAVRPNSRWDSLYNGFTALLFAVWHGYVRIVELLIDAGADVNREAGGKKVIDYATGRRKERILQLLVQAGAKS